jgi:hypothetical protein
MNPGPAPRPPPRLGLTPNTSSTLPGNMAGLSMQQSPSFSSNGSQMSLIRTQTDRNLSSTATVKEGIVKEGMVKVKDEGLFKAFAWSDRWLVLREFELNFFKSANASKVSQSSDQTPSHCPLRSHARSTRAKDLHRLATDPPKS